MKSFAPRSLSSAIFIFFACFQILIVSVSAKTAAHESEHSPWIGYTLPPYTTKVPQPLAQVSMKYINGTLAATFLSWSPPPGTSSNDVRIGVLSGKPGSSNFASNTIQVARDVLTEPDTVLRVFWHEGKSEVWAVGVGSTADAAIAPAPKSRLAGDRYGEDIDMKPPRLEVLSDAKSPSPIVNKPVILSAEGRVQETPAEKTFFQKYWWILLAVTFLVMSGGGDGK